MHAVTTTAENTFRSPIDVFYHGIFAGVNEEHVIHARSYHISPSYYTVGVDNRSIICRGTSFHTKHPMKLWAEKRQTTPRTRVVCIHLVTYRLYCNLRLAYSHTSAVLSFVMYSSLMSSHLSHSSNHSMHILWSFTSICKVPKRRWFLTERTAFLYEFIFPTREATDLCNAVPTDISLHSAIVLAILLAHTRTSSSVRYFTTLFLPI